MKTKNNVLPFPTTAVTPAKKPRLTAEERFKKHVPEKPDANGCLIYQGPTFPSGYGRFTVNSENVYAHRFAWEMHNKAVIPAGKYVLHSVECRSRQCCAKDHLRLGSAAENAADRIACGRSGRGVPVTRTRLTPQEKETIARMVLEGYSQYRISQAISRPAPSVAYHLKATNQIIAKKLRSKAADITKAVTELSQAITDLYGTEEPKKAA